MTLKRSCVCGGIHKRGEPCPLAKPRVRKPDNRPVNPAYRDPEYVRNRAIILSQFRIGDPCVICTHSIMDKSEVSVEHIVARRNGGSNSLSNLGAAHKRCNSGWRKRRA